MRITSGQFIQSHATSFLNPTFFGNCQSREIRHMSVASRAVTITESVKLRVECFDT